jgi:capsid portal protein
MNKQTVQEFMNSATAKRVMKEEGVAGVARLAMMAGNVKRDNDLRELAGRLMNKEGEKVISIKGA